MLPNLEITAPTGVAASAATPALRRTDGERALEAYRLAGAAPEKAEGADFLRRRMEQSAEPPAAPVASALAAAPEKSPADRLEKADPARKDAAAGDQVDIALQLTREERDALASAFGGEDERARMTPEERETARKASERITHYLDEAIARKRESRERMEKAVTEWYSRLSKGTDLGPTGLIGLFRQAAAGELDDVTA